MPPSLGFESRTSSGSPFNLMNLCIYWGRLYLITEALPVRLRKSAGSQGHKTVAGIGTPNSRSSRNTSSERIAQLVDWETRFQGRGHWAYFSS